MAKRRQRTAKVVVSGEVQVKFESICALAGYSDETAKWAGIVRTAMCEVQRLTGGGHFAFDILASGIPKNHVLTWASKAQ
jgi:hypothetical protein